MNTWKLVPAATLAVALLAPLSGAAFSLGEINVLSYLGAPFRATIPLKTVPGEEVDITCLSLTPPPPVEGMLYLRHAKFSLAKQGSTWQLVISGENALNEPYLSVFIQNGCQEQGRLVREYTVLIDPETYTAAPQIMEEKPATNESSAQPTSTKERASYTTASSGQTSPEAKKAVKPAVMRKNLANHTTPPKDRLKVVSGSGEAPAKAEQTEKERLQQREKELAKELDDKTAQFLTMQAQLATLESKLDEMQKTIALQNKMLASMQKPTARPQQAANRWKDYWLVGPGILIAGLIYFFASRSRRRSLENWQPTLRGSNSGKI